ncbi:MAG: NeuD/PglB/VioB family sugar acetyltransferase [Phycisphaerales bacterium]|nr:NeuD/PglB/VioB family sugar acetyltransferase [Phycisphaerales bacterium]
MPEQDLILLGAGGHAAVVAEAAALSGWTIVGFLDDRADARLPLAGVPHLGRIGEAGEDIPDAAQRCLQGGAIIHAAAGTAQLRKAWLARIPSAVAATIVHPSASVSASAQIAAGVFIGPNAVVNARAVIGAGTIVNSGAIVEHDVVVGTCAHLAPRTVVAGEATIGSETLLGVGSVVLPKVRIGERATLAAGSVATSHIASDTTVAGAPAR